MNKKKQAELERQSRVQEFAIGCNQLMQIFAAISCKAESFCFPGIELPEDAIIQSAYYDPSRGAMIFRVWSETFDIVAPCLCAPMVLEPIGGWTQRYRKMKEDE